eukprot:gnl/Hemi2/25830_TR8694_c0_g1_i1.p2 gnl/Hemi2/25830_TR8694_c0_g1~~gnl/Hemi2/25830_TR8694_c0_g1_i1.p2  ORF type:complete len:133 (+),score=18.45 gnl/Hemi2/25830_TR8694_c0_g1_i1:593-991(+)
MPLKRLWTADFEQHLAAAVVDEESLSGSGRLAILLEQMGVEEFSLRKAAHVAVRMYRCFGSLSDRTAQVSQLRQRVYRKLRDAELFQPYWLVRKKEDSPGWSIRLDLPFRLGATRKKVIQELADALFFYLLY